MNNLGITNSALLDLKHMLADKDVLDKLSFIDLDSKTISYINVGVDGSIRIGKSKYPIINRIFNSEIKISLEELLLKISQVLSGFGEIKNKTIFYSLVKDVADAISSKDYSKAISRIFIAYRLGFKEDIVDKNCNNERYAPQKNKETFGVLCKDGANNIILVKDITIRE